MRIVAAAIAALLAALVTPAAGARTLADVKARGAVSMCAHPDALPHASRSADTPGFQVELGQAIAAALGVKLEIAWIVPRMRAGLADCDLLFDTIVDPATQRGPVRLSQPYQKSGVALALRDAGPNVQRFDELRAGQRVGVMINSLASKLLNQRGLATVPYAFESDMVEDLAKGELDACAVSPATVAWYIRRHPESGLRYVHAYDSEPELRWNVAVGVRRSDDALVAEIDRVLAQLARDGTLARIYARYGVELRQP